MAFRKNQVIGRQFGKLTVIERGDRVPGGTSYFYVCRCECGATTQINVCNLRPNKHAKSCGCEQFQSGSNHNRWTGYGELSGHHWRRIVRSAKRYGREIPFDLTITQVWDLFLQQDRKCALSGLPLKFGSQKTTETTASLDRIDSAKGYVLNNVQWVHKDINRMKQEFDEPYFLQLCRLIVKHSK
jgi:hypothetical protein